MKIIPELTERQTDLFFSKVDQREDTECWNWKDYLKHEGAYGLFYIDGEPYLTHRVVLFIKTKEQFEVARHTCDNGSCCNPNHLVWGSVQDNIDDMMKRGRHGNNSVRIQGEANGRAKLKVEQVKLIRELALGQSQKSLSVMFNMSIDAIHRIIRRHTWKNI